MIHIKSVLERGQSIGAAATLLIAALVPVLSTQTAAAAGTLTTRSLMVSSTSPGDQNTNGAGVDVSNLPGDPNNGSKVDHTYKFTVESGTAIRGITISYCSTPFGYVDIANDCTVPTGFDSSAWNGGSVTVTSSGGDSKPFTVAVDNTTKVVTLTNATGLTVAANDVVTATFDATTNNYFVNPFVAYTNATYFAHISTFASDSSFTTSLDEGTVTNNITKSISILTRVQETLNFSVEGAATPSTHASSTYPGTGPCTPLTADGSIRIGDTNDALAADTSYYGRSFFRLATNSAKGAKVYYAGSTLKSGTNDINPMGPTKVTSAVGSEQFGLAFDATDTQDHQFGGPGVGLAANAQYADGGIGDFAFDPTSNTTPTEIASSTGVVKCDTGSVKYVANIADDTPAGIYTTKINYIASPSY